MLLARLTARCGLPQSAGGDRPELRGVRGVGDADHRACAAIATRGETELAVGTDQDHRLRTGTTAAVCRRGGGDRTGDQADVIARKTRHRTPDDVRRLGDDLDLAELLTLLGIDRDTRDQETLGGLEPGRRAGHRDTGNRRRCHDDRERDHRCGPDEGAISGLSHLHLHVRVFSVEIDAPVLRTQTGFLL
mgnify:CR=1 FL=1